MRTTWMLVSIGSLSTAALGSPTLQFATAINQGDALNGAPSADTYNGSPSEFVVAPNGDIGVVAQGNDSTVLLLLTKNGASWSNTEIANSGSPTTVNFGNTPTSEALTEFDNLAATAPSGLSGPTRITFSTKAGVQQNVGLLQYDAATTNNPATISSIAFQGVNGVTFGNADHQLNQTGPIEFQMNSAGNALFIANNGSNLIEGNATVTSPVFSNGALNLTSDNPARVGIAADNSGVALLGPTAVSTGPNKQIYSVPGLQSFSGPSLVPVVPEAVLGYASVGINNVDTALMLTNDPSHPGNQQVIYSSSATSFAPQSLLTFTPPTDRSGDPTPLRAELAPNGQAAIYVPAETVSGPSTVAADHLVYANIGATNPAASVQTIAMTGESVIDPGSPGLSIQSLLTDVSSSAPMINQSGITIFNALIGTSVANEVPALLEWTPGAPSPEVLLAVGDQLSIGNNPALATITNIDPNTGNNFEDSYFRNTFNDNGELAVAVEYQYADNTTGSAVLVAQLPEPTAMALLPVAGILLFRRRRTKLACN